MSDTATMGDAGKAMPVPRGQYSDTETYDYLDFVYSGDASYIAKKLTTGNPPAEDNEFWQLLARGGTLTENSDVSNTTVTFKTAETRSNIFSRESLSIIAGKVSKMYSDLKAVAFSGKYTDLEGRVTVTNNDLANVPGTAWDAVRGAQIRKDLDKLNSDFSNLQIDNFTELLTEFGINTATVFNSMDELNLVIPKNTHTLCTINADATGKQLINALPSGVKYGILEIIKGYNNSFCKFIYYSSVISTNGRIYVYDSRYSSSGDNTIDSSQEWKEIAYMAANSAGGDVLTEFNFTLSLGDSIILKQTPNLKKYAKLAFVSGSTVNGNPSLVGLAYPWLLDRQTGWNVGTANSYYFTVTFGNKQNVYRLENDKLTWVSGDVVVRYIIGLYS